MITRFCKVYLVAHNCDIFHFYRNKSFIASVVRSFFRCRSKWICENNATIRNKISLDVIAKMRTIPVLLSGRVFILQATKVISGINFGSIHGKIPEYDDKLCCSTITFLTVIVKTCTGKSAKSLTVRKHE